MAAIQDPKIRSNLEYNYGTILNELLARYSVLMKFYDDDIKIGKNKWYSAREGKTHLGNSELFMQKTSLDKSIINGQKRITVRKTGFISQEVDLKNIDIIIKLYEENPEKAEKILSKDYSGNFRKMFKYVLSLTGKFNDSTENKINKILYNLKQISGLDYISLDVEELEEFNNIMSKHIELSSAAIKLKMYDK